MINQKMILTIGALVVVGWIVISAIDAGTAWDSPIGTIQETGKQFSCPAPKHVALDFIVKLEAFPGESEISRFDTSSWVNVGASGGPLWFWHDYDLEVEVTYEGKTKTYVETIHQGYYTGLGGEDNTYTVRIVTDINDWEGECLDDWSYVQGYPISYTARLKEDGSTVLDTVSGTLTAV